MHFTTTRIGNREPRQPTLCATLLQLLCFVLFPTMTLAQSIVTTTSSYHPNAPTRDRRSFYDTVNNLHWAFAPNGSAVEAFSSSDGAAWTKRATLNVASSSFAASYSIVRSTPTAFLAVESGGDIALYSASLSATTAQFDRGTTTFDGDNATYFFRRPSVAVDTAGHVWVAALREEGGNAAEPYQVHARRSELAGATNATFGLPQIVGGKSSHVSGVSLIPLLNNQLMLVLDGASGSNIVTYRFDGSAWSPAQLGGDSGWIETGGSGLRGYVYALGVDSRGRVYAGGDFSVAGGSSRNVAMWNGTTWSPLGEGTDREVTSLAIDPADSVYFGGWFSKAGGKQAALIAKWDGESWVPAPGISTGFPLSPSVQTIAVDSRGTLYAGGYFRLGGGMGLGGSSVNNIARWDGNAWQPLGSGLDQAPSVIVIDASDNLIVGGAFTTAGGVNASGIARWNGSSWSALGTGVSRSAGASVYAIALDGTQGIYAGGYFTSAGGVSANNVARFDVASSTWSALGSGISSGAVGKLALGRDGTLYAGGPFSGTIAAWNGSTWDVVGGGTNGNIRALALDSDGSLLVGGLFSDTGITLPPVSGGNGVPRHGIARWSGTTWSSLGAGELYQTARSNATIDSAGTLYIARPAHQASGSGKQIIYQGSGSTATPIGTVTGYIEEMRVDASGRLFIGGSFSAVDNAPANNIAVWDGGAWSSPGGGTDGIVKSLAVASTGDLYIAGYFSHAGTAPVNKIARWDGIAWSSVGNLDVQSITSIVTDSRNRIYISGRFTDSGGTAYQIAQWDGTNWSPVGSGQVANSWMLTYALDIDRSDNLYLYGSSITNVGGVPVQNIARWNGSQWEAIGVGVSQSIYAIAFDSKNNLYVGGDLSTAGGTPVRNIARWDGTAWSAVAQGAASRVTSLLIAPQDTLYAFGWGGLSTLSEVVASDQRAGSSSSTAGDAAGNLYLTYINTDHNLIARTFNAATSRWEEKLTVYQGSVDSASASFMPQQGAIAVAHIDGSSVRSQSATVSSAPLSFSSPTVISSGTTPRDISSASIGSPTGDVLSVWGDGSTSPYTLRANFTSPPTVHGVTSPLSNGSYKTGDNITIDLVFSAPVSTTGTPRLNLATGRSGAFATYLSGSGTETLRFEYTVQVGDTTPALDYDGRDALVALGGAIQGATGQGALLRLALPGAPGSLQANQTIALDTTAPTTPTVLTPTAGETLPPGQIRFSGTGEPGTTVTIRDGSVILGTVVVGLNGSWEFTTSSLAEGSYNLTVVGADAAGNQSTPVQLLFTVALPMATPTAIPTNTPVPPTPAATQAPITLPTSEPALIPTIAPTTAPTTAPTIAPTTAPTQSAPATTKPTQSAPQPTITPTAASTSNVGGTAESLGTPTAAPAPTEVGTSPPGAGTVGALSGMVRVDGTPAPATLVGIGGLRTTLTDSTGAFSIKAGDPTTTYTVYLSRTNADFATAEKTLASGKSTVFEGLSRIPLALACKHSDQLMRLFRAAVAVDEIHSVSKRFLRLLKPDDVVSRPNARQRVTVAGHLFAERLYVEGYQFANSSYPVTTLSCPRSAKGCQKASLTRTLRQLTKQLTGIQRKATFAVDRTAVLKPFSPKRAARAKASIKLFSSRARALLRRLPRSSYRCPVSEASPRVNILGAAR